MKRNLISLLLFLLLASAASAQYIQFTENKGQWDSRVNYAGEMNGGGFFLEKNGYRVLVTSDEDWKKISDYYGSHHDSTSVPVLTHQDGSWQAANNKGNKNNTAADPAFQIRSHAYEVNFLNASAAPQIEPDKGTDSYNNYFIGNDKSKWASGCRTFEAVVYKNIYPNIDVRYYTYNNQLKYDIIVHPGGDVSRIALRFDGTNGLKLKKNNLIISTSLGDITELSPLSYQAGTTAKNIITSSFALSGNTVRFNIGEYDRNSTLVIDPRIVFCTFSGSTSDNWGYTATYDGQGNLYAGGISFANGFPTTLGAYSRTFSGGDGSDGNTGIDIGILKFNKTGNKLLFGTYIGGTGDEQPHSLVADADDNLIIAGRTTSKNFPATIDKFGTSLGSANAEVGNDIDIFLTKLNGTGGLLASRRFGGTKDDGVNIRPKYRSPSGIKEGETRRNYGDDARSEVITDASKNIYLASCTQSDDYPLQNAFQKVLGKGAKGGIQDGVVIKASPDLRTVYLSSFLGGTGNDAAFVLSLNPSDNNLYVAGITESENMPGIAASSAAFKSFKAGPTDGFVSLINNTNYQLIKTAYFGTGGADGIYGIQFDKFGIPYIMGTTTGAWPVINAGWSQSGGKQFISKLKPDLSDWIYSTTFGKGSTIPDISPTAFLVDRCENVYVSGWSGRGNSEYVQGQSSAGLFTTPDAITKTTDGSDFYFFVLSRNSTGPLYASFFGQNGGFADHVDGGTSRFDKQGVIYQAVCANCEYFDYPNVRFPTTLDSYAPKNYSKTGAGCSLASLKLAFELAGIGNGVRASIDGRAYDTIGCVPLTVSFIDTLNLGKQFKWDFGDGSPEQTTTIDSISHTYTQIGIYTVRLISIDSSSCNIADTAYTTIHARKDKADLALLSAKLPPCTSLIYQFTNTSTAPAGKPFSNRSFAWDFGDGSVDTTIQPAPHSYAAEGTYVVTLFLIDTNYCNAPDQITDTIRIAANVKAQFTTPPAGCAPYTAEFNNTSLAGQTFLWNFGDGTTSAEAYPTHLYETPGRYTVTLTAYDEGTCNKQDVSQPFTIVVSGKPTAGFTFSPVPAQNNTPATFFNTSFDATSYQWIWDDGDELTTTKRDSLIKHIYNRSDTFNVRLVAFNQYGCTDTAMHPVASIITPLIDVPNALAPTGVNRKITVRGFGIAKMDWRIYNRWGTMVFASNSQKSGWDGTYKGVLQPIEVYTYVLNVEFSDGTRYQKTGDITLIR